MSENSPALQETVREMRFFPKVITAAAKAVLPTVMTGQSVEGKGLGAAQKVTATAEIAGLGVMATGASTEGGIIYAGAKMASLLIEEVDFLKQRRQSQKTEGVRREERVREMGFFNQVVGAAAKAVLPTLFSGHRAETSAFLGTVQGAAATAEIGGLWALTTGSPEVGGAIYAGSRLVSLVTEAVDNARRRRLAKKAAN